MKKNRTALLRTQIANQRTLNNKQWHRTSRAVPIDINTMSSLVFFVSPSHWIHSRLRYSHLCRIRVTHELQMYHIVHATDDANMVTHLNFRVHFFRLKWFPDVDSLGTNLQAFSCFVQKLTGWSLQTRNIYVSLRTARSIWAVELSKYFQRALRKGRMNNE